MIFLILSIPFGVLALALYKVLKKAPEKVGYFFPLILTITLPAMYIPITNLVSGSISDKNIELLPIVGYLTIFIVFLIPALAATIIPVPIIDKLRKRDLMVFIASTLSFAYVILTGFAEVMGGGKSYSVTELNIVGNAYLTCFKLFVISSAIYVAGLGMQSFRSMNETG